jgi:arsenate reductase
MAEGLTNHFLGDEWTAVSAGTEPSGYVHPLAVEAVAELGIDISDQRSKSTEEFRKTHLDLVITVCDHAAENCPAWLGAGHVVHMGYPDPAAVEGSREEKLRVFRGVRDGIKEKILNYLKTWEPSQSTDLHLEVNHD